MANEPKKRSITSKLVANVLTEREDDFTCNVTYVANRSIKDLCHSYHLICMEKFVLILTFANH